MDEAANAIPAGGEAVSTAFAAVADTLSNIVDAVADVDRTIAGLMAIRVALLHEAMRWSDVSSDLQSSPDLRSMRHRSLRAELACVSRIPERTAESQLETSEYLTCNLPLTLAALGTGEISYRHAQIMVDNATLLDDDARAELERRALPFARNLTVPKFERKVRALREQANPETTIERRIRAEADREVQCVAARDGMAWLSAYLPAPEALGIFNRLTDLARAHAPGDGEMPDDRTVTQRRTDVFRDLLMDGEIPSSGQRGIRPRVFITVPVLTILGQSDEPAKLDGYGPIDRETARYLAANAPSFTRILTHPETGAVLSVGRDSYTVPRDLRNWLVVRDGTCRFPGCSRSAVRCEVDHTDDWAKDGETEHDNLAHLCLSHHKLKHASAWRVVHASRTAYVEAVPALARGTLVWTSPAGKRYWTEPEVRMRA